MKYTKTVNIHSMSPEQIRRLPVGQWVCTDNYNPLHRGRFWGVKPSGVVVVAWQGNARSQFKYWDYQHALLNYARN